MEMHIDSTFIRAERQKRGWSQEHLAAAAGLGVRTIQRLESAGVTSSESARALASVFEVPLERLIVVASPKSRRRAKLAAAMAAGIIGLMSSILLMTRANADGVALHVVVGSDVSGISPMNIEGEDGQQMRIQLERDLRLLLTPKIQKEDLILISAELYGWDGSAYRLASKPTVLTRIGSETKLRLGLVDGKVVTVDITPRTSERASAR